MEKMEKEMRLTPQEEARIDRRIRVIVLCLAGLVALFLIWSLVTKRPFGALYRAVVIVFLSANWLLSDVLSVYLKRGLAERSINKRQACMRVILFGLVANIGLGWFLLTMNSSSLFGALIYVFAIQAQRREREKYEQEPGEESEEREEEQPEEMVLPTAEDRRERQEMRASERMAKLGLVAEQTPDQEETEEMNGSV